MALKIINSSELPNGCKYWPQWEERPVEIRDASGRSVRTTKIFAVGDPKYVGRSESVPFQVAVLEAEPTSKYYKESINYFRTLN